MAINSNLILILGDKYFCWWCESLESTKGSQPYIWNSPFLQIKLFLYKYPVKGRRNTDTHCIYKPREQSGPVQFWSQVQVLVSALKVPWPEHWSGHMALAISQLAPPQPGWQWHSPWIHTPWAEQLGSMQSTEKTQKRFNVTTTAKNH